MRFLWLWKETRRTLVTTALNQRDLNQQDNLKHPRDGASDDDAPRFKKMKKGLKFRQATRAKARDKARTEPKSEHSHNDNAATPTATAAPDRTPPRLIPRPLLLMAPLDEDVPARPDAESPHRVSGNGEQDQHRSISRAELSIDGPAKLSLEQAFGMMANIFDVELEQEQRWARSLRKSLRRANRRRTQNKVDAFWKLMDRLNAQAGEE